jgi:hypothetical protein
LATTLGAAREESLQLRGPQALENSRSLRKIVKALGGEFEVLAKFPKGTVTIDQFDASHQPTHHGHENFS